MKPMPYTFFGKPAFMNGVYFWRNHPGKWVQLCKLVCANNVNNSGTKLAGSLVLVAVESDANVLPH